jgi:hypothetical protein
MALITWLETDSLTDQDISSALAIGVYTATGDKYIMCQLFVKQVAGSGDYVAYVTQTIDGVAYPILSKSTLTAAAGETEFGAQSGPILVRNGEIITVYLDGLAGDTTTVDTIVRFWEVDTLSAAQVNAEVVDALTVDLLADSVAADGTRPTIAQALYEIVQFLTEQAIVGTTVTVKKVDGTTSLMTFTLNDASSPTTITRET